MKKQGFTLIELLVVIAIIGLLSSVVLASLNAARMKARDAIRKSEFRQIATALELYYDKNGAYPNTGGTGPASGGAEYSSSASWLSSLVADRFFSSVPADPININNGLWCWTSRAGLNTVFTYISDGTHYILCGWMENTSDKDTLQYKNAPNPWNPAQDLKSFNYSEYSYVLSR